MASDPSGATVYQEHPPWTSARPHPRFGGLADAGRLQGRLLDVGCGTGEHTLLAAQHGAEAMGIDIAVRAINRALGKAAERGIKAEFQVADALRLDQLHRRFDTIIDSGVFHVFDDDERPTYVKSLRSALRLGGTCYLMCFSDRQPGDWGPRRVSEAELRSAFAEGWTIESVGPAEWPCAMEPARFQARVSAI